VVDSGWYVCLLHRAFSFLSMRAAWCVAALISHFRDCKALLVMHSEVEKRNHFSVVNKSFNMQRNLTKFGTLVVNEYYL